MYDPYAEFTKHVLPNGLEVHSVFWDRPWIRMEIVVHSGGREDPIEMPGLGHYVEHLVSANIPNREIDHVKEFFETCGGGANFGETFYLSTRYKFSVPADLAIFREALTIFGSMILGARLEKHIEREGKIILREFNGRYPYPQKLEWDMGIRKALFKGHRAETYNRAIGRPEGFLSASKADLQGYYDRHYVPANMSLITIGGLPPAEMIAEIERSPFGIRMDGVRNQIPQPFTQFQIPVDRTKTVKLSDYVSFKLDQSEYRALWAFPADFPRQALRIFDDVLRTILFEEVREKRGLAYNIGTDRTDFQDVYEYGITGRISPDATSYIDELVRKCILMVPARRDLFARKLKSNIHKCFMTDLSGSRLADYSAEDLAAHHRIVPTQEIWDKLHEVTDQEMAEAASLLSAERQYTFITCP